MKAADKRIAFKKRALFLVIYVTCLLLVFEVLARGVFFLKEGFNPYYITFGFVQDIEHHSEEHRGYSKFVPNSLKHQKHAGETIAMKINANGFRGERDFTSPKPDGTFRVATLGASSTFGYEVEDHDTYPYQLERMLAALYPDRRIEVLNLGIPHARISNILALVREEIPPLEPDLITLYCGYNNAVHPKSSREANVAFGVKNWLHFHSVAWRVVHNSVRQVYFAIVKTTNKDVADLPNLGVPVVLSRDQVEALRAAAVREFDAHVSAIIDIADSLGSRFMVVTQDYNMHKVKDHGLPQGEVGTYAQDTATVERIYRENDQLTAWQSTLLIHSDITNKLRSLAESNGAILVEGVDALQPYRSDMYSRVHLSPGGNRAVAEAIQAAIVHHGLISE